MKRRELLAGFGALGIVGAGAAHQTGTLDSVLSEDEEEDIEPVDGRSEDEEADNEPVYEEYIEPVDVPRLEAPGSSEGTETIPKEGHITYLSVFATSCGICADKMEPLGQAAERVDDDVQFVSISNEAVGPVLTEEDVIDWWEEHDGSWPVTYDPGLDVIMQLDETNIPYSVVIDAENRPVWSDLGYKSTDEILSAIDEAR